MDPRDAEQGWDDPVRGESTIPRAFAEAAARHAEGVPDGSTSKSRGPPS